MPLDKKNALIAVTENGMALELVDKTLQEDKEVVLAAVTQDGEALRFAHETLREDKEFMLLVAAKDRSLLRFNYSKLTEEELDIFIQKLAHIKTNLDAVRQKKSS